MNETIIKFDPTIEALHAIVEKTKNITATDLEDKSQLEVVKRNRLDIGKARIAIEKKGKELRADALKFQKDVIAKEKELLDIINPEEDRLKQIEKDAEALALKKERLAQLPERKERVEKAGITMTEEYILSLNMIDFEYNFNQLVAERNEKERLDIERVKQEQEAEKNRLENEKKQAEIQKIRDEELKAKTEKETLERIEADKARQALKEKQEQERLEKDKVYNDFKSQYDFDKEENTGSEIILWKKVATYKLN